MLENRTSAAHGQICINQLIESILKQVDIPLTLQEIEGDALFLYVRNPGPEATWQDVLQEVSRKLAGFFDAFIAGMGVGIVSTPCGCAICRNSDQLGLKIVVHAGDAFFTRSLAVPRYRGTTSSWRTVCSRTRYLATSTCYSPNPRSRSWARSCRGTSKNT